MGKFSGNRLNKQFVIAYNELKEEGVVKNKRDLGNQIGTYGHMVNGMLKGERQPTLEQLRIFCTKYSLNANFFFGKSNILRYRNLNSYRDLRKEVDVGKDIYGREQEYEVVSELMVSKTN